MLTYTTALDPFALALNAFKLPPQSLRLFPSLGLGRLLPVSLPAYTLLMPYLRQEYNPKTWNSVAATR